MAKLMNKTFKYNSLLIATNNPGKAKEISELLEPYNIKVVSLIDKEIVEPEETGITFAQNARLKAEYYGKLFNLPALADDSGLSVTKLDNYPGVYSARIAGENKDFNVAFKDIEEKLKQKGFESSPAFFSCVLSLWFPDGTIEDFEGIVDGIVSFPPSYKNGFGYDPIFTPDGYDKRFSEFDPQEKNTISHRGRAFNKFIDYYFK